MVTNGQIQLISNPWPNRTPQKFKVSEIAPASSFPARLHVTCSPQGSEGLLREPAGTAAHREGQLPREETERSLPSLVHNILKRNAEVL